MALPLYFLLLSAISLVATGQSPAQCDFQWQPPNSCRCALNQTSNNTAPANWLYSSELNSDALTILRRPDTPGAQIIYNWKQLEPTEGQYNFSQIEADLSRVESLGKNLWIWLLFQSYNRSRNPTPGYLNQSMYNNGSVMALGRPGEPGGWVAMQWNAHVRARFQLLLTKLAERFDGRIYGINLDETSVQLSPAVAKASAFSPKAWYDAEQENILHARRAFSSSHVVQFVNFWPGELYSNDAVMNDSFAFYAEHGIGFGGPDNIPWNCPYMTNSYPLYSQYKNKVPIRITSVQEPDYKDYINPQTNSTFTKDEFIQFARDYLQVDIIFWAVTSPLYNAAVPGRKRRPLTGPGLGPN
ncbi:hypothetical protein JDV02_008085 [Purpureocillium takamizusanense]|uniref:Uncharacterized protein n=1 Tax=Purpureocillium takamizusanense TaxID=2060973 RepID=A0A9Q8VEU1_9HYPO|nr:uncharacterized protein JDV02_008085 [Purpureocillium takamizusanense]UNI22172.1 hypothetical protein JDV02_008085 [Purpureocillium takamizusanense]